MGNKANERNQQFFKMVEDMRKDKNRRVNIHPQKKYLAQMIEHISETKLPQKLKKMVLQTLNQKVLEQQLIESITCINALKNNQFDISASKNQPPIRQKPESQFVKIIFAPLRFMNIISKYKNVFEDTDKSIKHNLEDLPKEIKNKKSNQSNISKESTNSNPVSHLNQQQLREKLKNLNLVLKKQLNRISNPFGKLNKAFAEFIFNHGEQILPTPKKGHEEAYEKILAKLINDWCNYLESSCLNPYKRWIMGYAGLQEMKYKKWIIGTIMQQIWAVNNGYLFSMLLVIINSRKIPLKININQIQYNYSILTPSLFNIDKKLQIEGHFFDSIYEMSQIESKCRPQQILNQLQVVKKRICTDIDNYHRLIEKGEIYEIDSDNILGIVTYILCKIANKIQQIYTHLIFLRIIYGDSVYYTLGVSSYMFSTIFGAFQFLQSEDFKGLLIKNACEINQEENLEKNKSVTKCTNSNKGDVQQKNNNIENNPKMIQSLILQNQFNGSTDI